MELKIELDGKEVAKCQTRPSIKERLEEQLELLAKASVECESLGRHDSLCKLTEAMVLVAETLDASNWQECDDALLTFDGKKFSSQLFHNLHR